MIYAVTGKPGKGKSYWFARNYEKWLSKGIDVYSLTTVYEKNLKIKAKHPGTLYKFRGLDDFRKIHDGIVVLDEAGSFFEAREWAKFSPDDRVKFQQHRKMELDIYLGVQSFTRLDSSIRDLTAQVIEIDCFPGSSREKRRKPWFFWTKSFDPENIDLKKRKSYDFSIYPFDIRIGRSFDSKEFVNLREQNMEMLPTMKDYISALNAGILLTSPTI